ncbi:hypothetical protein [Pantoea sp. UYEF8]|uniref:hypothetical protein n=1 Tax=Pantoea sp. UYEF8 TaxID=1756394 RepID=UPI0033921F0D
MNISDIPSRILKAFGINGIRNSIPTDSTADTLNNGYASYDSGFPDITMQPISAGGKPPRGGDMNGVLNEITAILKWYESGGGFPYDSTFSTGIGGYPKGAVIPNSTQSGFWLNTIDANTTNPEVASATATGWVPVDNYGTTSVSISSSSVTLSTLSAAKDRIILSGNITSNVYLYFPPWIKNWEVENNCTGSFSVICSNAASGGKTVTSTSGSVLAIHNDGSNITILRSQPGIQRFTATSTFTATTHTVWLSGCGGGGGGGGGGGSGGAGQVGSGGGGGGAGQSVNRYPTPVVPGNTYTVTIGNAGIGGTANPGGGTGAAGGNGGNTSFGSLLVLTGGRGGGNGLNIASPSAGAAGGVGYPSGSYGQDATSGNSSGYGGVGASGPFGGGGPAGRGGSGAGVPGYAAYGYGAGGGGGGGSYTAGSGFTGGAGGDGAPGFLIVEW